MRVEVQKETNAQNVERSEDSKRQRRRPRSLSTTSSKPPLLPSAKELPPVKSFSIGIDGQPKSRLVGRHRTAIAAAAALSLDAEIPLGPLEPQEAEAPDLLQRPSLESMAAMARGDSRGDLLKPSPGLQKARPYTRHRAAIRDARALCLNAESDIDRLTAPRLLRVHSVPTEAASESSNSSKKPPRATSETRQRAVSSSCRMRAHLESRSPTLIHDGPKC